MGLGIRSRIRGVGTEIGWRLETVAQRARLAFGACRVGAAFHSPTDMCEPDRLMIYALVRGLRPRNALEIGVRWGGSARIIAGAMEDNGEGRCVGLDPDVSNFRVPRRKLAGRYELVRGRSPEDVPRAAARLDGRIDLAFIDAMHVYACTLADLQAVSAHLSEGAHVLLHDTYHVGVDAAVQEFVGAHREFEDLGVLTRHAAPSRPVMVQGLRLLRFGPVDSGKLIRDAYGGHMPEEPERLWNYDRYAIRIGLVREIEGRYERVQHEEEGN